MTYPLTIASPDGNLFSGEVEMLTCRGADGDLAILAGHIPLITAVQKCAVKLTFEDGTEKIGSTEGGMLTVSKNGVTLLSGSLVWDA